MITVKLFAYYRDGRGKSLEMDEKQFPTPQDLCETLQIDPEGVGILLINGFHSKFNDILQDGDTISLFPPVAGG